MSSPHLKQAVLSAPKASEIYCTFIIFFLKCYLCANQVPLMLHSSWDHSEDPTELPRVRHCNLGISNRNFAVAWNILQPYTNCSGLCLSSSHFPIGNGRSCHPASKAIMVTAQRQNGLEGGTVSSERYGLELTDINCVRVMHKIVYSLCWCVCMYSK